MNGVVTEATDDQIQMDDATEDPPMQMSFELQEMGDSHARNMATSMEACGSSSDTRTQLSTTDMDTPEAPTASVHAASPPNYEEKYNNYTISEDSNPSSDIDDAPYELDDHVAATDIEIVNNLTCCLSFLLHRQSPLWVILCNNNEASSFEARCAHWQSHYKTTSHHSTSPTVNAQHTLHKLPADDNRQYKWPQLMHFWASWSKYKDKADCEGGSLHWNQRDIQSIKGTLDALCQQSTVFDAEDPLLYNQAFSNTVDTTTVLPLSTQDSMTLTRTQTSKQMLGLTIEDQMKEFATIETVHGLQNYLRRYKIPSMQHDGVDEHDLNIRKLTKYPMLHDMKMKLRECADAMKQQMRKSMKDSARSMVHVGDTAQSDDAFQLCIQTGRLPMTQWNYTHVVYWCDKALPSALKPFAVIFHEWRIDGNELMLLTEKHIECLIKCSHGYPTNHELIKLLNTKHITRLITAIRKCLMQSTIRFQYDLYWKTLQQIKVNPKHPLFARVWNIIHLIHFLRPGYSQGPKALWKSDAIYFAKIDDILSILVASTKCQKLFQNCCPRFIFDEHDNRPHALEAARSNHNMAGIAGATRVSQEVHRPHNSNKSSISCEMMKNMANRDGDALDKLANKCCDEKSTCTNRYCFEFIHGFDRVYCSVMMMLCLCVTLCCVTTICFMSYKSEYKVNKVMSWATESIGDRTMKQASRAFSVIHMVLSVAANELHSSAIPTNAAEYTDGRYDRFFTQYKKYKASQSNVYSLYLYELDHGTMIGSWSDTADNQFIYVFAPESGCGTTYPYDPQREKRNTSIMTCGTYDPTTRPWYTLAVKQDNGFMGWTEPYVFKEGAIGMTLVYKISYNDVDMMLFSGWLVDSIQPFVSERGVKHTLIYMITTQGNVIASDGTHDVLMTESARKILDGEYLMDIAHVNSSKYAVLDIDTLSDEYKVTLYSFHTLYTATSHEHAVIVLLYPYTHLDAIESAKTSSIALYVVSLSLALLSICFMGKQLGNLQKLMKYKSPELPHGANENESDAKWISMRHRCFCEHKTLLLFSFWYCVAVFIATYWIWHSALHLALDEILDEFLNEEYYAIHDTTRSMINMAETMTDIIGERLNRNMNEIRAEFTSNEFDTDTGLFLAHLMHTFRWMDHDEAEYYAHDVYIATPDGKFIGFTQDRLMQLRDASTDWDLTYTRIKDGVIMERRRDYDPRCREYYKTTLEYMVDSDMNSAFGGIHNLNDFYFPLDSDDDAVEACFDIQRHYLDIWNAALDEVNLTYIDSDDMNRIYRNHVLKNVSYECSDALRGIQKPLPKYDVVWSKYLFASGVETGLTASKPILDTETGDVLAIVAVDLTLHALSSALNRTNNYNIGEKDWISWIFSAAHANEDGAYDMIASSEGNVMYDARYHPNDVIRIDSKQIIDLHSARCGADALPINATRSQQSHKVPLPQDSTFLLAGRLSSYPFGDNGVEIDWIVAKSIDINHFNTEAQADYEIIAFVIICSLLCIWYVEQSIYITSMKQNIEEDDTFEDGEDTGHKPIDFKETLNDLHYDLEDIVQGSSSEIWGLFLNQYFANDSKHGVLTADIAKEFMAKESNKHISSDAANNHLTFVVCALRLHQKWTALRILSFSVSSTPYHAIVTMCIFIHCVCSVYLIPATPGELMTPSVMTVIYILLIIEMVDVVFVGIIARYIEFGVVHRNHLVQIYRAQFGCNHDYVSQIETKSLFWLMLFGTRDSHLFLIHLFVVVLIVCNNLLLMHTKHIAIFEYYIPVVPLLLAIRCRSIREFCIELFYALCVAKNVFLSYFFLITIVSIFAQAIFKDKFNDIDAWSDTGKAWITSFVFVSTGDNYNDIVTNDYILNVAFFVLIFVAGSFFFIPIIIRKFQIAFHDLCDAKEENEIKRKTNAYVAAFMYYSGDLSLYEFVTTLQTQAQRQMQRIRNNRWQCYLECNWFRTKNNRLYALIFLVIPAITVSLIRGIGHNDGEFTTFMVGFFFVCNFIDINLRCWAFGRKRYGWLDRYRNPAFIEEAISNYHDMNSMVKLTHIEKQWVAEKLEATPPMSKRCKSTLSLVHRFDLYIIWFGFIGYLLTCVFSKEMHAYRFLFLQVYVLRLFSLIQSNHQVIMLIFTIVPRFINLFAFLMLFILFWARIGCTMFATKTDSVPSEIYSSTSITHTSFDSVATSIALLLQIMIGKGWHEIMYLHMIATRLPYATSAYFIVYIVFVTLIGSNVAIALFLAEMEAQELKSDHEDDTTATKRKQILQNKLSALQGEMEQTLKQIQKIDNTLLQNDETNKKTQLSKMYSARKMTQI